MLLSGVHVTCLPLWCSLTLQWISFLLPLEMRRTVWTGLFMFSACEYIFLSHFLARVADLLTGWPAGWLKVIFTSWLSGFTIDYIIGQIIIWLCSLTQTWKFSAIILVKQTSIQQEYECHMNDGNMLSFV